MKRIFGVIGTIILCWHTHNHFYIFNYLCYHTTTITTFGSFCCGKFVGKGVWISMLAIASSFGKKRMLFSPDKWIANFKGISLTRNIANSCIFCWLSSQPKRLKLTRIVQTTPIYEQKWVYVVCGRAGWRVGVYVCM